MEKELFVKDRRGRWLGVLCYAGNGAPFGFMFTVWDHETDDYRVLELNDVSAVELRPNEQKLGMQHP